MNQRRVDRNWLTKPGITKIFEGGRGGKNQIFSNYQLPHLEHTRGPKKRNKKRAPKIKDHSRYICLRNGYLGGCECGEKRPKKGIIYVYRYPKDILRDLFFQILTPLIKITWSEWKNYAKRRVKCSTFRNP